jgi:malate synthase
MSLEILGSIRPGAEKVLTREALDLVEVLHQTFNDRRRELLSQRRERAARVAAGANLDFLEATSRIRNSEWSVAAAGPGLDDRRVEITGPTDRRMTINALNSGAKVWLADFEDANAPTWSNMVDGQINLFDAVRRQVDFSTEEGRVYSLNEEIATIVVRPRGLHLDEAHVKVDGEVVAGAFFDFALYLTANAKKLIETGTGPYFYLPKIESHLEARMWNDVFVLAQERVGIPRGTVRATVLIETITAAFEMEEILYELREHAAGLNAGRWDYMFSLIKYFRSRGVDFVLPDRNSVTMTVPFMRAYTQLLVRTCHRRGAFAIGGMSAFIPSRRDAEVNANALAKVKADKDREAGDGFDGSWVAHPDLVAVCRDSFDAVLHDRPNQKKVIPDVSITAAELLAVSATPGTVTAAGLRSNISVGLRYLDAWLGGNGAVAIDNLMEDAATAEISRSQIWQWIHNQTTLDTGEVISATLVERLLDEEATKLAPRDVSEARALFARVAMAESFDEFLTSVAYPQLVDDVGLVEPSRA